MKIILRNNGTISAFGNSQSTGTKNFLIVPRSMLWANSADN